MPRLFEGVRYDYGAVVPEGGILFTAGSCPLDGDGNLVGPGDHVLQAATALENLIRVLDLYGASTRSLVRTTVYVVGDHDSLVRVWNVIEEGLAPHRPPSTLLGVSLLGYTGQLVEIDGIAAVTANLVNVRIPSTWE